MIRRSVVNGLLVGLALALVSLLPVFSRYVYPRILHLAWPDWPRSTLTLVLVLHALAGLILLLLVGSRAARRSRANTIKEGFRAGAISGLVAAIVVHIIVLAPTSGLKAAALLWTHHLSMQSPTPPTSLVLRFVQETAQGVYQPALFALLVGGLLGGLEGAVVGWLRRHKTRPHPSLLEVVAGPNPRDRWFADQDDVWRAGILSGLIAGLIMWLGLTISFFGNLKADLPQLEQVVDEQGNLLLQALSSEALAGCLLPLLILTVVGTGALAVLLLKDPPRRHLSRFQAVLIAGVTAAVPTFLAIAQMVRYWVGLARYLAWELLRQAQTAQANVELTPDQRFLLRVFVHSPLLLPPFFYLLPLALLLVVLVAILLWLTPQAILYGLALPLVFRRPVDRAGRIARALHKEPNQLLPRLYRLFYTDARAVRVLPHLAFLLRDPEAARLVAAYHTLGSNGQEGEQAIAVIRRVLAEHKTWRWRAEVGELYRVLDEGLAARTLAQITAIKPPPQAVTAALPVLLSQSCEGIGRVLGELGKVERVDDLSTKIIFLNSAQAALLDLRRKTDRGSADCRSCATPYPEMTVLHTMLDRWQGVVLTATQDLQGRADLRAGLLASRTGFAPRVRQCVVITNEGLNVAQNIRLRLADGEGYRIVEGAEQMVDILGPGERREMEFWLAPEAPRRLRLTWELVFDDAVDRGRRVEFADVMELVQERDERPFQRIFPIPYVTGTPLRSGEMFVGRQDVFEFVREHLLGAYQNNVIVLHGQRRTGKTSILYRLQSVLAETHLAVLVDMQGMAARGTADFLYALSDDIAYYLENHDIFVDLPEREEYETSPEFTFRTRFLRPVIGRLGDRNLLLMFDEFEELQKRVEDGRLDAGIFPFLRNLMQHEPRLDFLFSGTHKLEELGAEYWSILFNIAAYKRITFLSAEEVRRLATEPVAPYGMEYDPLALERIIQVTAGHPYFTQVVCHELVAYHNETRRSYLTVTCVDQVLERIVERGEAHFKYIWAGSTPAERQVLLALTDLLPDPESAATPAQMADELARKGYDLTEDELKQALASLQAQDILTRSAPTSNLYRFKIDLIRRWIGITRPAL